MPRTPQLCRTALHILRECAGHPLPEPTLHQHLNARERPSLTEAEFSTVIATLMQEGCITAMKGEFLDPAPRWLITEKGEAALLKH